MQKLIYVPDSPYVANLIKKTMEAPKDARPREIPKTDIQGQDPFTTRDRMLYKQIVAFDEPIDKPFEKKEEQTVLIRLNLKEKKERWKEQLERTILLKIKEIKLLMSLKIIKQKGNQVESKVLQSTQNL